MQLDGHDFAIILSFYVCQKNTSHVINKNLFWVTLFLAFVPYIIMEKKTMASVISQLSIYVCACISNNFSVNRQILMKIDMTNISLIAEGYQIFPPLTKHISSFLFHFLNYLLKFIK
jgi:hypothetical protein